MRRSKLRRRESGSKLPHSQSGLRPRSESALLEKLATRHSSLLSGGVRVGLVVLAQQIFAVVVAVGRADDAVNVLMRGLVRIGGEAREVRGELVVELDKDYRAVDAVVEDAIGRAAADPGEIGVVKVARDLVHFHAGVAVVDIADV